MTARRAADVNSEERTCTAPLIETRDARAEIPAKLAADQTDRADLLVSARGTNDDLDVAAEPKENSDEPVGRESAQLPIEQQGNLRARFTRLVGDLHLRHVALVDDALNLREQILLPDKGVTNPGL